MGDGGEVPARDYKLPHRPDDEKTAVKGNSVREKMLIEEKVEVEEKHNPVLTLEGS